MDGKRSLLVLMTGQMRHFGYVIITHPEVSDHQKINQNVHMSGIGDAAYFNRVEIHASCG